VHYEMYVCLKKETYESSVPMEIQDKVGWNEYEYDEDGNITKTTAVLPTWQEAAFKGMLGAPRVSPNGSYILVKGEFSMKEGELSAVAQLGANMAYPNNTILTKSEAQVLVNSETWNNG